MTFVSANQIPSALRPILPGPIAAASDLTFAVSQDALTQLVRQSIDKTINQRSSGSWGPFVAGYAVTLNLSGGDIQLIDLGQQVVLQNVAVSGAVDLTLGLDLGNVLPRICIPPARLCIPNPLGGEWCTPQVCVTWPSVSTTIPIPIPPVKLSANFNVTAKQNGAEWDVILGIYPFSLQIDFTPTIDIIIDAVERIVHDVLGGIPLIGDLIEGLVDSILNALRSVIGAVLRGLHAFIQQIINLIDLLSPTIPYKLTSLPAKQVFLPAGGPGDREVSLSISAIDPPTIVNPEIVITANFA